MTSIADKRVVATDALATLGTILVPGKEQRDAIHLAVEPVIAGEVLHPNDDVGFLPDGRVGRCDYPVGKVDPFLRDSVQPNQEFWLVVYPGKVTSLRHVWEHSSIPVRKVAETSTYTSSSSISAVPSFSDGKGSSKDNNDRAQGDTDIVDERVQYSRKWIEQYAHDLSSADSDDEGDSTTSFYSYRQRLTADQLINAATEYLKNGSPYNRGPLFSDVHLEPSFWEHYSNVTRTIVPETDRSNFFRCSC